VATGDSLGGQAWEGSEEREEREELGGGGREGLAEGGALPGGVGGEVSKPLVESGGGVVGHGGLSMLLGGSVGAPPP
jgi:hypothetical protein